MFLVIFGIANELFVAVAEPPVEKLLIFSSVLQCRLCVQPRNCKNKLWRAKIPGMWWFVGRSVLVQSCWSWGAAVASAHRSHTVVCCTLVLSQQDKVQSHSSLMINYQCLNLPQRDSKLHNNHSCLHRARGEEGRRLVVPDQHWSILCLLTSIKCLFRKFRNGGRVQITALQLFLGSSALN